jgi:hypothetical protein
MYVDIAKVDVHTIFLRCDRETQKEHGSEEISSARKAKQLIAKEKARIRSFFGFFT